MELVEVLKPTTTITAQVRFITPEVAQEMLKRNVKNRQINRDIATQLAFDMEAGKWKENGEAFIIDKDGVLKDGQHRLAATIKANHSFWAVIIKGVEPDVMDTIDTGRNRTLSDVLYLNGFKFSTQLASNIKAIINYNKAVAGKVQKSGKIVNAVGFAYALDNKARLKDYVLKAQRVWKYTSKDLNQTWMTLILHIITKGKTPTDDHIEFLKHISGAIVHEKTAASWFYRTIRDYNKQKIRISNYYRYGLIIKAWNCYVQGNPTIQYLKFDPEGPLPKVL